MSTPSTALSRTFALDSSVLIPGSGATLTLSGDSPLDVIEAVKDDKPFESDYEIGKIALSLHSQSSGQPLKFNVGSGSVDVRFSASASVGLGVYEDPTTVINTLALRNTDQIELALSGGERYVLFRGAYDIKAHAEGTHPIGAVGALSFDVEASRDKVFAVIHRIPAGEGARTALEQTFRSLRLPGQFSPASVSDLQPGTMLVAEANGSLAMKVGAQVGYKFSFLRDLEGIGLTGQIGMHIETGLNVSLGFNVAGRYLVVLDRESQEQSDEIVRLRLFKLQQRGWDFGLNLSVGVIPVTEAVPENVDDLVRATFGLHGRQIIDELNRIEGWLGDLAAWTESPEAFAENAAGFISDALADVIEETTGIDPKEKLVEARTKLKGILKKWDDLPETVSSEIWGLFEHAGLSEDEIAEFRVALEAIANADNDVRRRAFIASILTRAGFDSLPISKWLKAAADRGLPALLKSAAGLETIARDTLAVLDGKFVENLQTVVNRRLNLGKLREAVDKVDYSTLDEWLKKRLARFVGKHKLELEELHEVASAVIKVLDNRHTIYAKARQALSKRRDFTFAYQYESTTTKTALIDAAFDLRSIGAQNLLGEALQEKKYDNLLVTPAEGVTVNEGVLTHQITQKSTVDVSMPFFSMNETKLTESLARVTASQPTGEGGRVLFYELDASNENKVADRLRGRLALSASASLPLGDNVKVFSKVDGALSYEYREARKNMRLRELNRRVKPSMAKYLPGRFPSMNSLNDWIADLNLRTDVATGTGRDRIGDTLFSLDLSVQGDVVKAWLQPRTKEEAKKAAFAVSLALQESIKELIPWYYFSNLDNLRVNPTAAPLLLWAAVPPSTSFRVTNDGLKIDGKGAYWDFRDLKEREAIINDGRTADNLVRSLSEAHQRLNAAGLDSQADFFEPGQINVDAVLGNSNWSKLTGHFDSLLFVETQLVRRAAKAIEQVSKFASQADSKPSEAIAALSKFGAAVTKAFNSGLGSTYGSRALRPLGTQIFIDAARALDPTLIDSKPTALMSLTVLNENSGYDLESFLDDEFPKADLIAAEERLTSVVASG